MKKICKFCGKTLQGYVIYDDYYFCGKGAVSICRGQYINNNLNNPENETKK